MAKLAIFSVLLVAAGCGGSTKATPATTPATPAAAADDPTCPVTVVGTSVTAEDTSTGAALVFVTTSDVPELRKRVGAMARMHNDHHTAMGPLPTGTEQPAAGGGHEHHDHGGGHAGHAGGGDHAGHAGKAGSMIKVHSKATSEDIDSGAKLVFIAFPDGVAKIQTELRMHASHLASGTCAMEHPR
jgi:hypothetical protein